MNDNPAVTVNVLIPTFAGLPLPKTLCLPVPATLSIYEFSQLLATYLPANVVSILSVSLLDNRRLDCSSTATLADVATSSPWTDNVAHPPLVTLCLSAPLVGGKGGFGSQLRAAGGRMSSKKRKQNAELATGSARNLDGRRLRTITEAKNLATYLATKPEMDRKEKEERRKRWEQVIDLAEQREADMRAGKTADGRRKGLSDEWIQEKEDVGDNVKNAVKMAMAAELGGDTTQQLDGGSDQSPSDSADEESDAEGPMELDEDDMSRLRREAESGDSDAIWVLQNKLKIPVQYLPKAKPQSRRFAGFDDDLSTDEEEDEEEPERKGKGKGVTRK